MGGERGEQAVFPAATEEPVLATQQQGGQKSRAEGVRDAVNVDDETAVLVLSRKTGQQRLVTGVARCRSLKLVRLLL